MPVLPKEDSETGDKDRRTQREFLCLDPFFLNRDAILPAESLGEKQLLRIIGERKKLSKRAKKCPLVKMERENESLVYAKKKQQKCLLSNCQMLVFGLGLVLAAFSIGMMAGGCRAIFSTVMKREMEVVEGSLSYKMWKKTPIPLVLKIYIWNITNHEAFIEGEKPVLQECGPYIWREFHEKKNLSFHQNNTVTYMQQRWWVWDEKLSGNRTRDDIVYTLNPVPISGAWAVRNNAIYIALLNKVFNEVKEQVVRRTTVDEVLFSGFEDPVLDWVQENVIAENGTYHPFLPLMNLPSGIANFHKFGWFYMRNMTLYYDGIFNMMTGSDDIRNVGRIDMWNYTRETSFFSPPCNKVTGSTGEFFEPGLERDKIVFYTSDLCMSLSLHYQKDVKFEGVKAYRFWGSNHTFANSTMVPENECFCVAGTCAPMGLINAESCRMGAPAFVSFPHYFNADPFLLDQVKGLSPNEEKHAFVMDIVPEVGIPINVKARMQINLRVKPYPGEGIMDTRKIDILKAVPDIYLPMLWFEETADVPHNMTRQLKGLQFALSTPTITICLSFLLLVGIIVMTCIVYLSYKVKYRPDDEFDERFPQSIYGSTNGEM